MKPLRSPINVYFYAILCLVLQASCCINNCSISYYINTKTTKEEKEKMHQKHFRIYLFLILQYVRLEYQISQARTCTYIIFEIFSLPARHMNCTLMLVLKLIFFLGHANPYHYTKQTQNDHV